VIGSRERGPDPYFQKEGKVKVFVRDKGAYTREACHESRQMQQIQPTGGNDPFDEGEGARKQRRIEASRQQDHLKRVSSLGRVIFQAEERRIESIPLMTEKNISRNRVSQRGMRQ